MMCGSGICVMKKRNDAKALTFSPLVKKCIERAKYIRSERFSQMRTDWSSREIAIEILQQIQCQPTEEYYSHLLDEIILAIEIEDAIVEESEVEFLKQEEQNLTFQIEQVIESQLHYSEVSSEECLLCPYCRSSAMSIQRIHENILSQCPNCHNQIHIQDHNNSWKLEEFSQQLAQIFMRHQQSCGCSTNSIHNNSVDIFLSFKQIDDILFASCDQCGFLDEILLA